MSLAWVAKFVDHVPLWDLVDNLYLEFVRVNTKLTEGILRDPVSVHVRKLANKAINHLQKVLQIESSFWAGTFRRCDLSINVSFDSMVQILLRRQEVP